ncbi:MAG: 4-phosphoerythronate dehydrogenase [Legionella sp.]|nr:MAG: 4-phosphoerythronate dehydrogenase [Legionella sp.]
MKILADATLPDLVAAFPEPFKLSLYHNAEELQQALPEQDILLCRANLAVNADLLQNTRLKYVATASSGTDHLDKAELQARRIEIIDAKGCNASAVADYIEATLAYLDEQQLIKGKRAGIIGLGKVGTEVHKRLQAADFQTVTYDPVKALKEKEFTSADLSQLFTCDLLCIHAELHHSSPFPSWHLINADFLNQLKPNTVIINAARGGIIDEQALLQTPTPLIYCTDVYLHEPNISTDIIQKATLCTPHIAGHSLEAKHAAIAIVSNKLHHILDINPPLLNKPRYQGNALLQSLHRREEKILAIYDPSKETSELKTASDKKEAFLRLRKQHHFRHDFSLYFQE